MRDTKFPDNERIISSTAHAASSSTNRRLTVQRHDERCRGCRDALHDCSDDEEEVECLYDGYDHGTSTTRPIIARIRERRRLFRLQSNNDDDDDERVESVVIVVILDPTASPATRRNRNTRVVDVERRRRRWVRRVGVIVLTLLLVIQQSHARGGELCETGPGPQRTHGFA